MILALLVVAAVVSGAVAVQQKLPANVVPPVVIVPGLGGSVLEAKLHNRPPSRDCATESDWYTIWASIVQGVTRYGTCEESEFVRV